MGNRKPSKVTGISKIKVKAAKIRRAARADMAFIERELKKNNIDAENLDYREFVVAAENSAIVGFGRLRKVGEFHQIGCVAVVEDRRRRGVGSLIVKHLLDLSSVNVVYIVTDLVDYFKGLGFSEMKEESKELLDALDEACKVKGKPNTMIMVYEKTT